ncbi:alpha/beta hydrolase [Bacillus niameyensis]|uniref:alpha/beta hydrolase n=1 Tax=Bacillus niameyensis TaxID=1522308 RepID=UPI00078533F5|nr:alpha/beta hydrolase-fold protein [Bacillus niameyensis]
MSLPRGTIQDIRFQSDELKEIMDILVYLPAQYSPANKYSLIIVQDAKDYFQLGRLARFADELMTEEKMEEVIIVGSHYKNVEDRRTKYHPKGEKNEAFIRFLTNELVPWIDQEYPINQNRAIMGDSLAGTVSLLTAIQHPDIFNMVILHSPYVDDDVITKVMDFESPYPLNIYQVIGKEESVVKISNNRDFLTPNRKLRRIFKEKEFQLFYDEFDGGHSWKYWQPDLKRALKKMFSYE